MIKTIVVLVGAILLGFLLYPRENVPPSGEIDLQITKKTILSLETLADEAKRRRGICGRVAIGYNSNLDLIVKALDVIHKLGLESPQELGDLEKISSIDEFNRVFSYFFEKGSAAERFVERETFERIVQVSASLPEEDIQWFTGGNAALMANRFAKEDCQNVLLGGNVGSRLASLLDPNVEYISRSAREDSQVHDEVHLILEYPKSAQFGPLTSPSDLTNSKLEPLEGFHEALKDFAPDLVVISGLHLLEGQPLSFRSQRLKDILQSIEQTAKLSSSPKVHLELASIGDLSLVKEALEVVIPAVDSLGLNEQELGSVLSLDGKDVRQDFKDPSIRLVIDSLKKLFRLADKGRSKEQKTLTRIHFHSLTFHVIAQKKGSSWRSSREAVAAGSVATSRQACDTLNLTVDNVDFFTPLKISAGDSRDSFERIFDPSNPVWEWQEDHIEFVVSPVLVCKTPLKTVGLGDAISTVGLVQQLYGEQ